MHVTDRMDLIQDIIVGCGGESKVKFLDISFDFIRLYTRVPMDQTFGKPVTFSTLVTKKLMNTELVHGVKWVEADPMTGGCYIMVSFKREEK
jgi:hypothetical protein